VDAHGTSHHLTSPAKHQNTCLATKLQHNFYSAANSRWSFSLQHTIRIIHIRRYTSVRLESWTEIYRLWCNSLSKNESCFLCVDKFLSGSVHLIQALQDNIILQKYRLYCVNASSYHVGQRGRGCLTGLSSESVILLNDELK